MIGFETDESQNQFAIRYRGAVTPQETERGLEEIRAALARLRSGFRLLVDLTQLEQMDVACAPFIEKAMDLCNEKGASMVVRVIPDPQRDIGMAIMSIFHYGGNVQIITCQTLAEAVELLRARS